MAQPSILLQNGRIIDPFNDLDIIGDLFIKNGGIHSLNPDSIPSNTPKIDLTDKWIVPGLIDMHVHLREPGEEYKETIASGTKAGSAGGFSALACMPNTQPVLDNEQGIASIIEKAEKAASRVYPVGAISKNSSGNELAEFGEMKEAGAVAFTDDGLPVVNSQLMRRALEYAKNFNLAIISHSEETNLSKNGAMNEGAMSTRLGLIGIPSAAEAIMVYRDLALAELTGHHLHLAHISTQESVALIRRAKAKGCRITAETAPHYFTLTEDAIGSYNTYAKMNPPLRSQADVDAIIEGMVDGTIDAIASDHAPHSDLEKKLEFDRAANGIIGLETSLSLGLRLVHAKKIDIKRLIELMSVNPAKILGVKGGTLSKGVPADLTVIDPKRKYTYTKEAIVSTSQNTPFIDWEFTGKAVMTIVGGNINFNELKTG